MPGKKPTAKALAARRAVKKALQRARRATRQARKSVAKAGTVKAYIHPATKKSVVKQYAGPIVIHPPNQPHAICAIKPEYYEAIVLYPPRVPTQICDPPKPVAVTRGDIEAALDSIGTYLEYVSKVVERVYPKRPK